MRHNLSEVLAMHQQSTCQRTTESCGVLGRLAKAALQRTPETAHGMLLWASETRCPRWPHTIWKDHQYTGKAHANVLQTLTVMGCWTCRVSKQCREVLEEVHAAELGWGTPGASLPSPSSDKHLLHLLLSTSDRPTSWTSCCCRVLFERAPDRNSQHPPEIARAVWQTFMSCSGSFFSLSCLFCPL